MSRGYSGSGRSYYACLYYWRRAACVYQAFVRNPFQIIPCCQWNEFGTVGVLLPAVGFLSISLWGIYRTMYGVVLRRNI